MVYYHLFLTIRSNSGRWIGADYVALLLDPMSNVALTVYICSYCVLFAVCCLLYIPLGDVQVIEVTYQ